jgi:hypothetical protein
MPSVMMIRTNHFSQWPKRPTAPNKDQLAPVDEGVLGPPALSKDEGERIANAESEHGNKESEDAGADIGRGASVEGELFRLGAPGRKLATARLLLGCDGPRGIRCHVGKYRRYWFQ